MNTGVNWLLKINMYVTAVKQNENIFEEKFETKNNKPLEEACQ